MRKERRGLVRERYVARVRRKDRGGRLDERVVRREDASGGRGAPFSAASLFKGRS